MQMRCSCWWRWVSELNETSWRTHAHLINSPLRFSFLSEGFHPRELQSTDFRLQSTVYHGKISDERQKVAHAADPESDHSKISLFILCNFNCLNSWCAWPSRVASAGDIRTELEKFRLHSNKWWSRREIA